MAVNLQKNKESLTAAWKDVVDDKCPITWSILGYEGNSNDLKVVIKGDGDLEEMVEELNSGKIMYCFCRVKDPNSNLVKFVLINWLGEGVPESRKGSCTNHIKDVAKIFHGAHVTINARTDEDVDPETILEKVSKSSVANFNFEQERPQPEISNKPVGTVYKRTIAAVDINAAARDKFWEKTEEEERCRKEEDQRKSFIERERLEQERKKREEMEATKRDEVVRQRIRSISEIKAAERAVENQLSEDEKKRWEHQQHDIMREEDERRRRSESLRQERKQEAQELTAHKATSAKAFFEQHSSGVQPAPSKPIRKPPAKIVRDFTSKSLDESAPISPVRKPSEPIKPISPPSHKVSPVKEHFPPEGLTGQSETITQPEPQNLPHARNLLKEGLHQRETSEEEENEEEQDWESPPLEDGPTVKDPLQVLLEQQLEQVQEHSYPAEVYREVFLETVEQSYPAEVYQEVSLETVDVSDLGIKARALYDYQAADDTEISFDPDDIISHIEMIDEGWWRGLAPDGSYGLFPANYVELV